MGNTQLTVLVKRCVMYINPDQFFDNSTLVNIRKLFRYVFQEPDRNTETIAALGGYLSAKVAETKADWHQAGVDYTNGYVDVKRAKAKHEKYQKILTAFEAVKNKNNQCTE